MREHEKLTSTISQNSCNGHTRCCAGGSAFLEPLFIVSIKTDTCVMILLLMLLISMLKGHHACHTDGLPWQHIT